MKIPIRCRTMVLDVTHSHRVTALSPERGVEVFEARAIVLAMGCRERARGALMIPGTRPAGVYCAGAAQRLVNLEGLMPGRRVVILGSGDIGLIMARRMTCEGAKILACVELMPYSSGLMRNIVQCLDDFGIPLLLSHTVTRIRGRERVEGVTVSAVGPDCKPIPGTEREFDCDTLLLSCGLLPENELSLRAGVPLSPVTGGAFVDDALETEVPGVFACGNVLHVHDLVDHVSAEAEVAGRAAARRAATQSEGPTPKIEGEVTTIVDGNGVRGCVPQKVRAAGADEKITLSFRPSCVFKKAMWRIRTEERVIFSRKAMVFTPGESQSVEIPRAAFAGADEAIVEIVREDAK